MSLRLTLLAGLMSATAATAVFAQVAPPQARPAAPYGAAVPLPPAGPLPRADDAAQTSTTGTVVQLLLNPNGDADGLLLSDGTQVAFAPHMGDAVIPMLKVGDKLQVGGWRAPGAPVLRMQTLSANGRGVTDQPPTPGAGPRSRRADGALSELSASGRVDRPLFNDRGDVHGVILSDRTIVRFPPHLGASLTAQLQPGAALAVRGWGTRSPQGTAIEATAMGASSSDLRTLDTPPAPRPPL